MEQMNNNGANVVTESNDMNQGTVKENNANIKTVYAYAPVKSEPEALVGRFPILVKISVIFAAFFTFCLYDNYVGITIPLYTAGMFGFYMYFAKLYGIKIKPFSWFLMVGAVLLGISTPLTMNPVILWWNAVGRVLLTVMVLLHDSYDDVFWSFFKYFCGIFEMIFNSISNIFKPFSHMKLFKQRNPNKAHGKSSSVAIGLLIGIPLLLVVVALLGNADATFGHMLGQMFFDSIFSADIFWVIIMLIASFLGFYGTLCAIVKREIKEQVKAGRDKDSTIAITITLPLLIVYLLFCMIQIINMATAGALLPEDYTYAEYAREGFFQLLFVCLINICTVVLCMQLFRENKILKFLLTGISICTYIMTASSAYRMLLYISVYGLTRLRIIVLVALAGIALVLAGIIINIYQYKFPLFRFTVVVVTVLYVGLSFFKMDQTIAIYNLEKTGLDEVAKYYYTYSMDVADIFRQAYSNASLEGKLDEETKSDMDSYFKSCKKEYQKIYGDKIYFVDFRKFNVSAIMNRDSF